MVKKKKVRKDSDLEKWKAVNNKIEKKMKMKANENVQ